MHDMYQVKLQGEYAMAPKHKAFKENPRKKIKAGKREEATAQVQKTQPKTKVSERDCFYYTCTTSHNTCTRTHTQTQTHTHTQTHKHTHTHTKQDKGLQVADVVPKSCHPKPQPQPKMKQTAYKKVRIENNRVSSTLSHVLFIF